MLFRAALVLAGLLGVQGVAWAKENGFPSGVCEGCHKGGQKPTVTVTAEPAVFGPGESTTISVRVSRTNGNAAGFYLTSNKKGTFSIIGGPTKLVSPTEVVHSSTGTASSGDVTFQMRWTAPGPMRGSVDFEAWALSANGNGASSGDGEGSTRASMTYGCEGMMAYLDHDGDGFGRDFDRTRVCDVAPPYVLKGGDCDDNNKDVYPGHAELCNFHDDNCNGMINEGLPLVTVYRDDDGDGHGARFTTDTMMRCGPVPGYGAKDDDCNDKNRVIYPGAMELCDNLDNDCNGRVDDGARASCGVGWCRRLAPSCESTACTPGPPRAEICNYFDDDCDGVADNGPNLCPEGKVCFEGLCLTRGEAADAALGRDFGPEPSGRDGGAPTTADAAIGASPGNGGGGPGAPPTTPEHTRPQSISCAVALPAAASWLPALLLVAIVLGLRRRR